MWKTVFISLVLVVLDQASKFFAITIKNYGGAFGILQGYRVFFILVAFVVIFILFYYRKMLTGIGYYGGIFVFSGTIGNLIDRIFLGYVRDFIDLGFWPSFNFADIYNTSGVLLLVVFLNRSNK